MLVQVIPAKGSWGKKNCFPDKKPAAPPAAGSEDSKVSEVKNKDQLHFSNTGGCPQVRS